MRPRFDYGDEVRVTRNVRNDGTYPGMETGVLLVRRGSIGHVQDMGTFLQDQIIYTVNFLEINRIVGCREEELISVSDSWIDTRYEFRDKVIANRSLAIGGEIIIESGLEGEVLQVFRNSPGGPVYHIRFPGRTLQVPEFCLDGAAQF